MNDYIYTNSTLVLDKIYKIIKKSKIEIKENKCNECNKKYKYVYKYKNISISRSDIHRLKQHNKIDINFYNDICKLELKDYLIDWYSLNTNGLNILDGVYEDGSFKKYIEKTKNIKNTKILRFSEHSGLLHFKNKKLYKIDMLNHTRLDSEDPIIYMPRNTLEGLEVDYLFHTHPKTPYIGSRLKNGILYEFPSISDITHFIEHHNDGRLLGSIVVAPEGIYIIRKNNFNRRNIKIDYDLFLSKIEKIYDKNFLESYLEYKDLNYSSLKENRNIKIPEEYFYKNISINYKYINNINNFLKKYDIYIDYYARIELKDKKEWIFSDINVPIIN